MRFNPALVERHLYQCRDALLTPWQHAAILPSEMLAFCCAALEAGVDTVVESGRRFGYSTEFLCRFPWRVISIDSHPLPEQDSRLKVYANLRLVTGDGEQIVPSWVSPSAAVLLDGPKGMKAVQLAGTLNAAVIAIHDCYPGTDCRATLEGRAWFSDDPEYLSLYGHLDADMLRERGYSSHSEILPVANVLAILDTEGKRDGQ